MLIRPTHADYLRETRKADAQLLVWQYGLSWRQACFLLWVRWLAEQGWELREPSETSEGEDVAYG